LNEFISLKSLEDEERLAERARINRKETTTVEELLLGNLEKNHMAREY
jgi:hypothetical protein